jgi:hypothetical protein
LERKGGDEKKMKSNGGRAPLIRSGLGGPKYVRYHVIVTDTLN